MADRDHVGVGVNVLLEVLGVAVIGAEPELTGIGEVDLRNAADADFNIVGVLQVADADLIQDGRAKGVYPAGRARRGNSGAAGW